MQTAGTDPILLVDDDSNDVLLFQRAAAKARLANAVDVVRNGDEAVAYLSRLVEAGPGSAPPTPVVVLLDIKMPRRSGFEVLEWIREQPGLGRLPVVVFSASGQDPDVNRAYDLGANSYLVKPVTFESLVETTKSLGLYWTIHNRRPEVRPAQ